MSERFSGQVMLVAGGTGGLGHVIGVEFLAEGATVVVTYRRHEEFEALRHAAGDFASRLEGHNIDVTNDAAAHQMISSVVAKHGRLDAMTNRPRRRSWAVSGHPISRNNSWVVSVSAVIC